MVSIFAGVSRYRFSHFLGFALFGRLIWTAAYLGLGYGIGGNIDAASQFLGNLSGLIIALGVLVVAGAYRRGSEAVDAKLKPVARPQPAAISVPNSNHAYLRS